jgi:hypothetical protein
MEISIFAGLITFVIALCICKPIEAEWSPTAGKCLSPSVVIDISYLVSAASILTDLSCAILPIVLFRVFGWIGKSSGQLLASWVLVSCRSALNKTPLTPEAKHSYFDSASTTTIVRLKILAIAPGKPTTSVCLPSRIYKMANITFDGLAPIAMWSVAELGIGLSAGFAAALRPLLRLISSGSLQHSTQTRYAGNQFKTIRDTATHTSKVSLY